MRIAVNELMPLLIYENEDEKELVLENLSLQTRNRLTTKGLLNLLPFSIQKIILPKKVFEQYKERMSPGRSRILHLDLHPIAVHFPQTLLVFLLQALLINLIFPNFLFLFNISLQFKLPNKVKNYLTHNKKTKLPSFPHILLIPNL